MKGKSKTPDFPLLVQEFFYKRLVNQQNASPETVAGYRDTFRLLLRYLETQLNKRPADVTMRDLDAPCILAFLDYLEKERKNSIPTRNTRLAAIRSFMKYAALQSPALLPIVQKVLAIPMKRFERPRLGFLSRKEIRAVLDAPDASTRSGQRDRVMFAVFYNTGARVSEITGLRVMDLALERAMTVNLRGKGRKQRVIPLWKSTAKQLKEWLKHVDRSPEAPLFPNRWGQRLTRSGVENRLKAAVTLATKQCPTLKDHRITPHTFRHSTATHLLQSGVDLAVIALWLGHESPTTTHVYMEADIAMKEKALSKIQEPHSKRLRYRPTDKLLQFLEGI